MSPKHQTPQRAALFTLEVKLRDGAAQNLLILLPILAVTAREKAAKRPIVRRGREALLSALVNVRG